MLALTREQGQSIYVGRRLSLSDLDGTCDYRIDIDVVDHRIASRRIELTIIGRFDVERHTLTPAQPDLDFAPDCRVALLRTYEYLDDGVTNAVAKIGLQAPREMKIIRDNARAVVGRNGGVR
jgi:sRNA-binding carbon storage regulator CsrA